MVTYPVVVMVDTVVKRASRNPDACPPLLPDVMNAHSDAAATNSAYTRNSVDRSSGPGSRRKAR